MATYRVETDNGTYDVEVDDKPQPKYPLDPSVVNEPGLQDVSLTPLTEPDLDKAGEDIATSKFGQKHPYLGAAAGTAVAKAPDIIAAVQGVGAAPELAAGVRGAGSLIKKMGKSLVKSGADEELSAARTMLKDLPIKMGKKKAVLEGLDKEARTAISAAEEKAGLGMKEIPTVPKDSAGFANEMKVISKYNADELLETMPVEHLQDLKKQAQVLKRENILPEEQAFINQGVEKIDAAIAKAHPEVGDSLSRFRQVQDATADAEKSALSEKQILQKKITELMGKKKGSTGEKVRSLISKGLVGTATGIGGTLGYRAVKNLLD